jgi:1,4-alpha-glucan branching enzyme
MTHPGKKLTFMGGEIGQFREWDYKGQIEWFLLDYDTHAGMQRYFADLNQFYLAQPALWQCDDGWDGFCWINADDKERSILSFRRCSGTPDDELLVLLNFTPVARPSLGVNVPAPGQWQEVFNSDALIYGGGGMTNPATIISAPCAPDAKQHYIALDLPPLSAVIFKKVPAPKKKRTTRKK